MSDILTTFINKKKAESPFLTIGDGESVKIEKLREIKVITKIGFGGEEKEVLRLIADVQTAKGIKTKNFDNGTQRFAQEMQSKNVVLGSAFTISREGTQTKTRYIISDVVVPKE